MNRRQADQWEKHGQGDKIWAAQANSLFVLPIFVVLGLPCQTCHLVQKSPKKWGSWELFCREMFGAGHQGGDQESARPHKSSGFQSLI